MPATYIDAAVKGVPLVIVVMGLVWLWGKLGLSGKVQLVSSMVTGLVIGMLYMVSVEPPPIGEFYSQYVYWFSNTIYGIGLGLGASGFYETLDEAGAPDHRG